MSSHLYFEGRQRLLDGYINWLNDDIRVALVTSGYVPDFETHDSYNDLTNIVAESSVLTGKQLVDSGAYADPAEFLNVTGSAVSALVVFCDDAAASPIYPLIAYIDNLDEFPYTPDGSDVTISWTDDGATPTGTPIFSLVDKDFPRFVSYTTNASSSLTLDVPSGVSAGDLLVAGFAIHGAGNANVGTTGWHYIVSYLNTTSSGVAGRAFFWKTATGSEPSSYTFSGSVGSNCRGLMAAYTGCTGVPLGSITPYGEVVPSSSRALWVGMSAYNSNNNGLVPSPTWTNATSDGSIASARLAVGLGSTKVDNGPYLTSLSAAPNATYLDYSCAFAIVAP